MKITRKSHKLKKRVTEKRHRKSSDKNIKKKSKFSLNKDKKNSYTLYAMCISIEMHVQEKVKRIVSSKRI